MASSGMLHCVALVRTDVLDELSFSFMRVTRIGELGTTLAVSSNRRTANVPSSPILVTLMKEMLSSSETSVLKRATWHNIPEHAILNDTKCQHFVRSSYCFGFYAPYSTHPAKQSSYVQDGPCFAIPL
jgi:hypothetical protein